MVGIDLWSKTKVVKTLGHLAQTPALLEVPGLGGAAALLNGAGGAGPCTACTHHMAAHPGHQGEAGSGHRHRADGAGH